MSFWVCEGRPEPPALLNEDALDAAPHPQFRQKASVSVSCLRLTVTSQLVEDLLHWHVMCSRHVAKD